MVAMDTQKLRDTLIELVKANKDSEAISLLRSEFFSKPLITDSGDDSLLDYVVNPIGLGYFYTIGEYERAVRWWDAVITILRDYESANGVTLHKGMALHNKGLPLIRLNRFPDALETIQAAHSEDVNNFPDEAINRPAYLILCFLKPIVDRGHWRSELLDPAGTDDLYRAFEGLYSALRGEKVEDRAKECIRNIVDDNELKTVLFRRYEIVKKGSDDALMRIVYAGSILEGILGNLLSQQADKAIQAFVELCNENKQFLFFVKLCDESFSRYLKSRAITKEIKNWDLTQMIKVAHKIALVKDPKFATFYILGNLLRDYRNLVHPSKLEAIGKTQGSDLIFEVDKNLADMISKALDIVLMILGNLEDDSMKNRGLIIDSGQHSQENNQFVTGVYAKDIRSSLASPSRVRSEDIKPFDPFSTGKPLSYSTSVSSGMGSTTMTSLPNQQSADPNLGKTKDGSGH